MAPTTNDFLATLTETEKAVAEEILSALSFPEQIDGLADVLAVVESLIPDMRMTCPAGRVRWETWARALPALHANAAAFEPQTDGPPAKKGNRRSSRGPRRTFLSFLRSANALDEETGFRLNALKGLLLAANAARALGKLKSSDCERLERLWRKIGSVYADTPDNYRWCEKYFPGTRDRDQWLKALEGRGIPKARYHPARRGRMVPADSNWLNDVLTRLWKRQRRLS